MQDRIRSDAYRTARICVDSYKDGVPAGRLYISGPEEERSEFRSLSQLLISVERVLDSANYPQSYTAVRSFTVLPERAGNTADKACRKGERATFTVKVLFRQHASWQGSILWKEKQVEQPFRSVLELILLMDSALGGS